MRKAKKQKQQLVVISNDDNIIKRQFLELLFSGVEHSQIGYMDGMDPETGKIVPLLVGLNSTAEGLQCYPLAEIFLDPTKLKAYLAPDGKGAYSNSQKE